MDRHTDPPGDPSSQPRFTSLRRRRLSQRGPGVMIVAVVALLLVGFGGWWFLWGRKPASAYGDYVPYPDASADSQAQPRPAQPTTPAGSEAEEAAEPLPALSASDELVRRLAEGLSTRPRIAAWLATDGLVRRFVVVVANVAQGVSPASHLEFMKPSGSFAVEDSAGRMWVDPKSYQRYDGLAAAFASLDAAGTAKLFQRIRPLCEQAYRELGLRESFDDALAQAFGRLLAVRVPRGEVDVAPSSAMYGFTDENLEALSPAAKHLLRMGPDNARLVQAKLRELADAMGVEPRTPPRLGG